MRDPAEGAARLPSLAAVPFAFLAVDFFTGGSSSTFSSAICSIEERVWRVLGRFFGMANGSSGTTGDEATELAFRRVGLFDVVVGGSLGATFCALGGGGDVGGEDARFLALLGGLPLGFFWITMGLGFGAGAGSGSSGGSCGVLTVFCFLDPRVKRKSPSCSSYTAASVVASG